MSKNSNEIIISLEAAGETKKYHKFAAPTDDEGKPAGPITGGLYFEQSEFPQLKDCAELEIVIRPAS